MSKYLPEGWTQDKIDDALESQRKSPNPTNPKQEGMNMRNATAGVTMIPGITFAGTFEPDGTGTYQIIGGVTKADGLHIVRAVNAHDALVEAVKGCLESQSIVLDMIRNGANLTDIETEQLNGIEIAETALKLAKGE